jgi:hypothetical protein
MLDFLNHFVPPEPADPAADTWARQRRAPRECDHALTGTTRRWLRQLPGRRRPLRLCELHPRVANRIAWCWHDLELTSSVLEDLLEDRRGGRTGFAPVIVRELHRLRDFHDQHRAETTREPLMELAARVVGMR